MKKSLVVFLLILVFSTQLISSNSIISGHIEWTCIGKDSFLVKLYLTRDCNGSEIGNVEIGVFNEETHKKIETLLIKPTIPNDITPTCRKFNPSGCTRCSDPQCEFPYGFEQFTFYTLLVLDSSLTACKIKLEYTSCCRSSQLENIKSGQGFYIHSKLNRCLTPQDNSPSLISWQVLYAYNNNFKKINIGLYDPDVNSCGGLYDSITFQIVPPKSAIGDITFINPYSFEKPLPFLGFPDNLLEEPKGFHFDTNLGEIHFTPTKAGLYSFTLKVEEYRDQVLIGEILLDNAILVITDTFIHKPQIITETFYKEVYVDSTVRFTIDSWHPDPMDTLRFIYNGEIEGALWSDNYKQTNHPTGIFTWTPDKSKVSDIPYSFSVSLRTPCGLQGSADRAFQIKVIDPTSSISDDKKEEVFVINNYTGLLKIKYMQKPSLIIITSIDGKRVFKKSANQILQNLMQVNTTTYSSGYYTVMLQIDGELLTKKVFIQ